MTKVSVFGQEATESKQLKPIELVKRLYTDGIIESTSLNAKDWDNVQLFDFASDEQFDTILAWDDDQKSKCIFLGHWNDGVV